MATESLQDRVSALEAEVAQLKAQLNQSASWVDKIWGTFANDPLHEEAMRLGKQYRESLRPKARRRKK